MCELLWSDPQPQPGRSPSKRGVGVGFGAHTSPAVCTHRPNSMSGQASYDTQATLCCSVRLCRD